MHHGVSNVPSVVTEAQMSLWPSRLATEAEARMKRAHKRRAHRRERRRVRQILAMEARKDRDATRSPKRVTMTPLSG